ncbi:MAG TPA: chain length determinant protein EpsF [Burkholderiaceae bacterium]|nr:chain length determinant protein EpsF [Burkholderiaceae bacterium]
MTPSQLLLVIWARKQIVLGFVIVLAALAFGVSMLLPRVYTAQADLLIDLRASDPVMGTAPSQAALSGYVATQVDIIGSARVARAVVDELKLTQEPYFTTAWNKMGADKGDLRNWIVERLLDKLDVRPSKEGNVVRLSWKAPDPILAARVTNGFAQAYLETVLQLKVDPARQNSRFFEDRLRAARGDVERAQSALSIFQRDNNIISVDERTDVETARLTELSSQLVSLQAALVENQSRQAAGVARNIENMPEVLESRLIQQLKGEVARLEARLRESASTLGTAHPQYVSMKEELTSLRERLDYEIRRYGNAVTLTGAVNTQREQRLKAAIEQQRTKLLKLKALRDQMAVLQKDVDAAQRAYEQVAQRQNQTSMESLNRQTNVALLTPAVEPDQQSSPKPKLNTIVGGLVGLLLGVATALLLELRNRRARTIGDITEELQLPILVVVPDAASRRSRSVLPRAARTLPRPLSASREITR